MCAVLLDLIAMGKIEIEFEKKTFLFVNYTDIWVKVSHLVIFFDFLFIVGQNDSVVNRLKVNLS